MKQREQARLLIKKALQDEALLTEILPSPSISDEIFGFHCQQASEKLLKAALSLHGVEFTLFRYEDLPEEIKIDRGTLLRLVKSLRSYVENEASAAGDEKDC